ncbi:unnamed protein product [Sympodiomycopsis kandeliae]
MTSNVPEGCPVKTEGSVLSAQNPEATQASSYSQQETFSSSPDVGFNVQDVKLEGMEDPRNWTPLTKWSITSVIAFFGFISPLGASIVIAGARGIDEQFHLHSRVLSLLPVSIYVIGLGLGPLVLAPISELRGRQPVYISTAVLFLIFNVATALAPNYAALLVLRFIAGATGSTGPSLGGGTIGDMFGVADRARAQALYGLGPLMGPVVGNIIGGWIDQTGEHNWRWVLWALTIMSGMTAVILIFGLRETYGPVLLRRKQDRMAREHAPATDPQTQSNTRAQFSIKDRLLALKPSAAAKTKMQQAMSRPFRMLFTNPICAIMACYLGFCYGIIFLFLVQHPLLYQRRDNPELPRPEQLPSYNWGPGMAGLTFIGLAVGFLVATGIAAGCQNRIYELLCQSEGRISFLPSWTTGRRQAAQKAKVAASDCEIGSATLPKAEAVAPVSVANKGEPEYRLPLCAIGMLTFPVGLFVFGWAAEYHSHWAVPLIGSMIVGAGTILCFQSILVYMVDAFIPYSASAVACAVLVRSIFAAVFPLFAEKLYRNLGFGWGSSLLAFVGLAGFPVPFILFRYGGPLRRKFRFNG